MTIKVGNRNIHPIGFVCILALFSLLLAGSAFATAPTVTSFAPTSAAIGATVTITGTSFTGATAVKFNTTSAPTYTVVSSTSITATVPTGATTGKISVTTSGGTGTSTASLTIVSAPTITSFSPTTGAVGATVTITGTNFTGATGVKFNTTAATTFTVVSSTSITATVPTGATTGTISVTAAGVTVTSSSSFTVVAAPTVTSFTPTSGPISTSVTITGTNFTGATAVLFNTTNAPTFTVVSSTSITATVPSGATTGKISVTNAGVTAQSSSSFTVTVPAAPTGLSALGGSEKVVLGWSASTGAATYNVYRGTSAGHESTTAIVTGLTSPVYTDTGVSDGSTYYYYVKAVNGTGTSSASSEVHAEPVAAPTSLYGTQQYSGGNYVAFGWNASSAGATSYNLYRGVTPGGESSTPVESGGTNTFANDYGPLTLGTTYYYYVKGVNSTGLSSPSNEVEIIPIAPTTLSGTFLNASASLSWTAVSGASSYNLYGGTSTVTGITGTSYTSTGLTNNQQYNFYVTAVNSAGEGPASNTVSGYPNPTSAAPTSLTATPISSFIHLSWTTSINGCVYNVFRGTTSGGEGGTAILTTSGSAINDTTAVAGTTYYYEVSATNGAGTSGLSNEASAATLVPPVLTLTSSGYISGNYTVDLSWTNVSPAGAYNIYLGTYSGGESLYISNWTYGTAASFSSGLYANTSYYMYVTSLDSGGHESAHSNEVSALMPLANPTGLTAAWSGSSVLLNWTAVSGATTYTVQRQIGSGTLTTLGTTSSTSYTDSTLGTLASGTSINYIVAASSTANHDSGGTQVYITTPTVAPSGLSATGGLQSANLSWTGSTGTNYYNIKRSTTSGGPYTTVGAEGASPTTYTDTGLSDNTTYYYVVSSVYTGGESANSNQAAVVTAPTAPASLTATPGSRQIGLSWPASTGASTYNVYQSVTTGGPYTVVGSSSSTTYTATGLADNTAYYYVVTAVNSSGAESGYSPEATTTTWLAPPTLSATSGNASVTLNWTSVSGATGYTVYRSAWSLFSFANISGGTLVSGTSYVDNTVTNGVDYYYVVTYTVGTSESAYSNVADAYPSAGASGSAVYQLNCGGPAVGTWLADTSGNSTYSTTNFIDLSKAVNPAPEAVYQTCGVSNTSLNYTVPGLTASAAYTVRLHFADAYATLPGQRLITVSLQGTQVTSGYDIIQIAGGPNIATVAQFNTTSDASGNIAISLTGVNNYPILSGIEVLSGNSVSSAPFNLHALPGHAQVVLGWNGYSGLTGYNVYRGTTSGGPYTLITSTPVTGTTYTDSTVSNGTTYFYVVTAVNGIGESERSNEASATPESVNASVYRINCGGPAVGNWSSDIQGYIFSTTSTPDLSAVSNPAPAAVYQTFEYGAISHTLIYLVPGANYVLRLHFDNYSPGSNTSEVNVTINGTQVLTNFDARAASGAAGKAVIEQFNVTADTSGNVVVGSVSSVLTPGGPSGIELLTDSLAPSQPTRLFAWRGNTQVTLNWSSVYGAATYKVYRSLTSGGSYTLVASGLTSPTYSDPTVTNYYYVVTAVNSTGESGYSNQAFPASPFTLTASPSSVSATATGYATSRILATSNTDFAGTISYSGSSGPTGVTGLLYPASSVLGSATEPDITITTGTNLQLCTSGAATGTDPITITGTCGDYTATTTVNLTVH